MSITEILEKHLGTAIGINALERDLSQLLDDRAKEFFTWYDTKGHLIEINQQCGGVDVVSELYALFLTNKTKEE